MVNVKEIKIMISKWINITSLVTVFIIHTVKRVYETIRMYTCDLHVN